MYFLTGLTSLLSLQMPNRESWFCFLFRSKTGTILAQALPRLVTRTVSPRLTALKIALVDARSSLTVAFIRPSFLCVHIKVYIRRLCCQPNKNKSRKQFKGQGTRVRGHGFFP